LEIQTTSGVRETGTEPAISGIRLYIDQGSKFSSNSPNEALMFALVDGSAEGREERVQAQAIIDGCKSLLRGREWCGEGLWAKTGYGLDASGYTLNQAKRNAALWRRLCLPR
jgi:hypothetical protein